MPIELLKGDIFETPGLSTYAHGVDCAGEMSAGIAGQFKKRWPAMYEEYRVLCDAGRLSLGDVFPWMGDDVTIYNLAIQKHWRETAKGAALAVSLRKMVSLAAAAGITRVGLPRIASGLGGLGWTRVRQVLDEVAPETPVTLVVFEQFVRSRGPSTAALSRSTGPSPSRSARSLQKGEACTTPCPRPVRRAFPPPTPRPLERRRAKTRLRRVRPASPCRNTR